MSAAPKPRMTVEQFERYAAENGPCELIDGEVHPLSPASPNHGEITGNLHGFIWNHVREHRLGKVYAAETGFRSGRDPSVRAADVAFIARDRLPDTQPPGFGTVIPDLVAETVSPGDRSTQVTAKVRWWLDEGVKQVWVVDPQPRTVTVYHADGNARMLTEPDELTGGAQLPGFALRIAELFG